MKKILYTRIQNNIKRINFFFIFVHYYLAYLLECYVIVIR